VDRANAVSQQACRTALYRAWVAPYSEEQGIPFVPAPKGVCCDTLGPKLVA
jgi:hypothetical protein